MATLRKMATSSQEKKVERNNQSRASDLASDLSRLEKYEGVDYEAWKRKLNFFLAMLDLAYTMAIPYPETPSPLPIPLPNANAAHAKACMDLVDSHKIYHKWEKNDCGCRGRIIHGMIDALFNVFEDVDVDREVREHCVSIAYLMAEDNYSMDQCDELCKVFEHLVQIHIELDKRSGSGERGGKRPHEGGGKGNVGIKAKVVAKDKGASASKSGSGASHGQGIISIPFYKNKSEIIEVSNIE